MKRISLILLTLGLASISLFLFKNPKDKVTVDNKLIPAVSDTSSEEVAESDYEKVSEFTSGLFPILIICTLETIVGRTASTFVAVKIILKFS